MNWQAWITQNGLPQDLFPQVLEDSEWEPRPADTQAAWILYTEMRTRIATQPLHFRAGDETSALTSLYQLFELVRKSIRDNAPDCRSYAILATTMLNGVIRPFTAKWHKRYEEGDFRTEDMRREFRAELSQLQSKLRCFQTMFGRLVEGDQFVPGTETAWSIEPALDDERVFDEQRSRASEQDAARLDAWWPASARDRRSFLLGDASKSESSGGAINRPIRTRIDFPPEVDEQTAHDIRDRETKEIELRRKRVAEEDRDQPSAVEGMSNLIGLAISGGGIRSATFSLGVLQRLSQQGLLREVDYLSTVSGGGYTGAFLSSYLNSPNATTRTPRIALAPAALPFRCPDDAESRAVRWIRNRSSYLLSGGFGASCRSSHSPCLAC